MAHSLETINEIMDMHFEGRSSRSIAKKVLGSKTKKSTVNYIIARYKDERSVGEAPPKQPKILLHDIETAPSRSYVWGRFKQNVGQNQVISEGFVLTWAAQWLGQDKIMWDALDQYDDYDPLSAYENDYKVVESLWKLYDEADIVIAHNAPFDTKTMNARFAYWGLRPPSPYKIVDTLQIAKSKFRFPSNRLDSLGDYLKVGRKVPTGGFELWSGCYAGDKQSFKTMTKYNIGDIHLLRDVYMKLRAWDGKAPNLSNYYDDSKARCVVCGSTELFAIEKKAHTGVSTFDVLTCDSCGHHNRKRGNIKSKEKMSTTLMNA